ncbi:MAG: 3-hydroxybutyryl-CoA dehydrogenase [Pseudomonadales bacterium]|nr:3-hydroxybutyryl-CoA dehydrogenase [Pseudomonadales bacterium]
MSSELNKLTVLGAGVLGGQIAWHSAYMGKDVVVYDLFEEALGRCRVAHEQYSEIYRADLGACDEQLEQARQRLRYSTDLADAVAQADLVIEAVPEIPEVKTQVYCRLAPLLQPHCLIATNSSTLLPSDFAEDTGRPAQYCALHFANLIWSMNVAEIMAHAGTAEPTLRAIAAFAIEIGMVPIPIQKPQNGYVLNSLLVPLLGAAQTLVTNGISTPEMVDRTYMITNRGVALGPFGIMDVIGMKTCYDVLNYWGHQHSDAQTLRNAAYIKEQLIDQGKMGLQTGSGYYQYPNPAYAAPDFLAVPGLEAVEDIVRLTRPG